MTMFGSQWLANAGADYEISQSIRFNDDDSAFLARTPLASNRKTWTFSAWVKRAELFNGSVPQIILSAGDGGSNDFIMQFGQSDDTLRISDYEGSTQSNLITTQLFRDVSAWYHFALVYDTTQGTAANRIKLYVNGSQVTAFGTETYPSQNNDLVINSAIAHNIGRGAYSSNGYFSGYIAEINFVDGTAKSPTDFGEYNDDGVWIPKKYSGAYGTSGYYLTGADSTALGEDVRISGDQVISYAASQYTGATGSYTYSNGRLEADTDNKAIRTADTFTGDFEFSWRYNNMANFVIGVYETGEDGTFNDSTSAAGMNSMTDSWYIQTSSVAANRDIFYGGAVQVNATTIADGDTWKMTRSSGTIKLIRNGSDVHTFSQTSTNTVRIAIAQGDAAADLGQVVWVDNSTLGNNFFSSGLAAADQVNDSPTNNHCTLNPIQQDATGLSDGNLQFTTSSTSTHKTASGTIAATSGKYYCEVTCNATLGSNARIGIIPDDNEDYTGSNGHVGDDANSFAYVDSGVKESNNSQSSYGASYANGDVIAMALNLDDNEITFFKDGASQGAISITANTEYRFAASQFGSGGMAFNFGQAAFAATPPTGFTALNTANLPEPSIKDGSGYFHTQLYTGNGSSGHAITNDANAGDFQPDFLWLAPRSNGDNHVMWDVARGTTSRIYSNKADPADVDGTAQLTFEADGFDLDTTDVNYNGSGRTYVAWQWKTQGAAGSSNTDGSINTTTTSVNQTAGFSINTYTGTGSNATVGHGLGAVPKMILIKDTTNTESWIVYHEGVGNDGNLYLNLTNAKATQAVFQDTTPTSSVFSLGTTDGANKASGVHVAYCFAEVPGYSSFGSYTGNGSTDGPFVYTGFKPAFVMTKRTNAASDWKMWDNERVPYNVNGLTLAANSNGAESSGTAQHSDFLSNGLKIRGSDTETNGSGSTYIYMAFAENPFGGDGAAPATAR